MKKKEMINTIKGLFDKPFGAREVKRTEKGLEDVVFVEELIARVGYIERKDYEAIKELYLRLSDIRFDLAFQKSEEQRIMGAITKWQ